MQAAWHTSCADPSCAYRCTREGCLLAESHVLMRGGVHRWDCRIAAPAVAGRVVHPSAVLSDEAYAAARALLRATLDMVEELHAAQLNVG